MVMSEGDQDLLEEINSPFAILGQLQSKECDQVCASHLCKNITDDSHLICLTATECPDSLVKHWREHIGTEIIPKSASILLATPVEVGGYRKFLTPIKEVPVDVYHVHPSDLTGIMIAFEKAVTQYSNRDRLVCLRGLNTLLMYTKVDRVSRLLNACMELLDVEAATVHGHLLDDEESEQLFDFFDTVVQAERLS